MNRHIARKRDDGFSKMKILAARLLPPVFLLILIAGGAMAQETPLGSLTSVGDVFINALPAPPDTTAFAGDVVRVGDSGSSTFTLSGKGSIKLSPGSQVLLANDPRYLAELQSGTVVIDSFAGATNVTLRAGSFIVGPVVTAEKSASRVERMADGSFNVTCLDGSIGLIPLQGATGRVLQANQSLAISSTGELGAIQQVPAAPSAAAAPASTPSTGANPPAVQNNHKGWIILGVVGAGAVVGIAAAAAGHGGGNNQAVSPSTP